MDGFHLPSFTFGERIFTRPYDEMFGELETEDERRKTLAGVLGPDLREFGYLYDFGGRWRCRVAVVPRPDADPGWAYPLCIGGARAVPPDDVGGPPGYERFREAIRHPGHGRRDETLIMDR